MDSPRHGRRQDKPVYAAVTRIRTHTPFDEAAWERGRRDVIEPLTQQAGFRAYYTVQASDTDYLAISVWESAADYERALQQLGPVMSDVIEPYLVGSPERIAGEVVEHRS